MKLRDIMNEGTRILKEANIEAPVVEAGVLLCHVLGCDKTYIYTHSDDVMKDVDAERFFEYIGRRAEGEPVQYITGHQEFMSLDFKVTQDVLIPRQDTEVLVETVIDHVKQGDGSCVSLGNTRTVPLFHVLDIGTGSGCIAVSLAYYIKKCHVTALDISEKALEIARFNAGKNGVAEKIQFVQYDILSAPTPLFPGNRFDIIVSNPPYIAAGEIKGLQREVRNYEPLTALDGGKDGLDFYRAIINDVSFCMMPGGLLALEVGYGQAESVCELMKKNFDEIKIMKDLSGIDRVITGKMRAPVPADIP